MKTVGVEVSVTIESYLILAQIIFLGNRTFTANFVCSCSDTKIMIARFWLQLWMYTQTESTHEDNDTH